MPHKIDWTPTQDALIRRLRAEGTTWDVIAAALSVSRFTIIERARRIGACQPPPEIKPPPEDPDRPPLPPGHPHCWQLLTEGTVLEGSAYPYPVFVTEHRQPPKKGELRCRPQPVAPLSLPNIRSTTPS